MFYSDKHLKVCDETEFVVLNDLIPQYPVEFVYSVKERTQQNQQLYKQYYVNS